MTDQYIDPNSGAAPQPGGYAGPHAVEQGHGPVEPDLYSTPVVTEDDAPEESQPTEVSEEEANDLKSIETQAVNPAEETDDNEPSDEETETKQAPEESQPADVTEEEAVDAKALETQGVNVNEDSKEGGDATDESEEQETETEDDAPAYDPSQYSVDEVVAYVEANPDQKDAVIAAEQDGKNRSTLLSKLS